MRHFTPKFSVQVSAVGSIIYTFDTLAAALRFAENADGTIKNEFGTILRRASWDM